MTNVEIITFVQEENLYINYKISIYNYKALQKH